MDLIKNVAVEADWKENIQESFDRSAYPEGVKASDVKAWMKHIDQVAKEHNKKLTRKLIKNILFGEGGFEKHGVFGNDPGWDLIADRIRSSIEGDDDKSMREVARAEMQVIDALWKQHLKNASDGALKNYHKAVEAEEKTGSIPRITDRQLIALGKKFKKDKVPHTDVYKTVRHKLHDYLEKHYGVHFDNLSQSEFQNVKDMVDYIVDNVYQRWAGEEAEEYEELVKNADHDVELDKAMRSIDADDVGGDDMDFDGEVEEIPDDEDVSMSFGDDLDDANAEVDMTDLDNIDADELGECINGLETAFGALKNYLEQNDLPPSVQKALVKRLVVDELGKWDINVE